MWGTGRARGVAAVALAAAACGGGGKPGALVAWAEGGWRCVMAGEDDDVLAGITVDAEVTVDGAANGTFSFRLDFGEGGFEMAETTGEWELDGRKLKVSAKLVDEITRYAMSGVELDTDAVNIQEQDPDAALQPVAVTRNGDRVTFTWDHENTGPASLTCSKAT